MTVTSGIGSLQQPINSTATSETKATTPASASSSVSGEAQVSTVYADHADQTSLSPLGGLFAQALESSDVRYEKVASLQQAIAAGSYSVPSSDVADKIIRSLLD